MPIRILTICPTKGKPDLCLKMVQSFHNTTECDNTLVLGIDIGDEKIKDYERIKEANKIFCKANSTVTEVINSIFKQYPDYDFYHLANDDIEYLTKGWDKKFVNMAEEYGHGIFYGNDLLQGQNLPTFPFISGEIVRALGWLQFPSLNRYAGDVVFGVLGKHSNCLYYLGGVIIKHHWRECADPDMNKKDMEEFSKWLPFSFRDVVKVKGVLNESKS